MQTKDRQKICSHCDGRIAVEADTCLFCGMPLVGEKGEEERSPPQDVLSSLQGGIPSLYPPLYSQKKEGFAKGQESSQRATQEMPAGGEIAVEDKTSVFSIVLTLLGSNLFILGLMQGFFSEGGVLRLEWNSNYWFAYLLLAAPLFFLGIKKSKG